MPEQTLEQELEAFVEHSDYRVRLSGGYGPLHVTVIYMPNVRAHSSGTFLITNGEIGTQLYGGPSWWRWRRARRYVRKTIDGHRRLVTEGVLTL